MAIPLPVLLAAAERLARDERTQKVARGAADAMIRKGGEVWRNRSQKSASEKSPIPETKQLEAPSGAEAEKKGWRGAMSKRLRFRAAQTGDLVRFDYEDEHGLSSKRTVGNWSSDGREIEGYCLNRKETCRFALNRISNWREIDIDM